MSSGNLLRGSSKSCGCRKREVSVEKLDARRKKNGIIGKKYGRLKVLRLMGKSKDRHLLWEAECECGKIRVVLGRSLRRGITRSCGCLQRETASRKATKHGMAGIPMYIVWRGMLGRCLNTNDKAYKDYGGRGIRVCKRWLKFENFFQDMGKRPEGMTLDREDNNGNYEPGNCRWATQKEQCRNTRRNKFVEYKGEKKTISEWAEQIGMSSTTLWKRLDRGWSVERALKPQHDVRRCI